MSESMTDQVERVVKAVEEIEEALDKAEAEITKVLKKYDLHLGMLYDDGIAITLNHEQKLSDGTTERIRREAF